MSGTISNNISQSSGSITAPAGGVSIVSSDPTLTTGLVWYNSTSNVLKVARTVGAWSAGGTYPSTHLEVMSTGTVSAAIAGGGYDSSTVVQKTSYEYNGTAWATNVNMSGVRSFPSRAGTQTSALVAGGFDSFSGTSSDVNTVESYNGTAWSNETNHDQSWAIMGGCGASETAAITVGSKTGSGHNYSNLSYEYNGASWASGGNSNLTGSSRLGTGTLTASIFAGGYKAGGYSLTSEEYNGTAHTAGNSMATARAYHGAAGTMTDALMFNGDSPTTEIYDGTSFASGTGDDGRQNAGAHGASSTSAYTVAGQADGYGSILNTTREFAEGLTARTLSNS